MNIKPKFDASKKFNVIVKNNTPKWRPLQPRLGQWNTKHKDGHTISKTVPLKEQFDDIERAKIDAACHFTIATTKSNDFIEDPKD